MQKQKYKLNDERKKATEEMRLRKEAMMNKFSEVMKSNKTVSKEELYNEILNSA